MQMTERFFSVKVSLLSLCFPIKFQTIINFDYVFLCPVMGNLDNWSDKMKGPMLKLYGERYLQKMLSNWGNSVENYHKAGLDRSLKDALTRVTCPTLIIHGELDPVLGIDHAEFNHQHIKHSS